MEDGSMIWPWTNWDLKESWTKYWGITFNLNCIGEFFRSASISVICDQNSYLPIIIVIIRIEYISMQHQSRWIDDGSIGSSTKVTIMSERAFIPSARYLWFEESSIDIPRVWLMEPPKKWIVNSIRSCILWRICKRKKPFFKDVSLVVFVISGVLLVMSNIIMLWEVDGTVMVVTAFLVTMVLVLPIIPH